MKCSNSSPEYIIRSYFKGDISDTVGPKCHFRRYAVEIYLKNCTASRGEIKLHHEAGILYYLGDLFQEGIEMKADFDISRKRGGAEEFRTRDVRVEWSSNSPVDAVTEEKKIATLLFCFYKWATPYSEIESRMPCELIAAAEGFTATADGIPATVGENTYLGAFLPSIEAPTVPKCPDDLEKGAHLSRFVLMADAHIGPTYHKNEYGWLLKLDSQLQKLHKKSPIDFVCQLGDNIDDGYAHNYERDYAIYLDEIKKLSLLDPVDPIEGRAEGKIPHYEMQGNHDTSFDTRFFRNRIWYTSNDAGTVAYIAFFTGYGGYPLHNYSESGSYESYRSYGVISDDTIQFLKSSIEEAESKGAKHIILLSHFGISQQLNAPVLPESGLSKLDDLCKKHGITLFFNGHEHNSDFTHRMYKNIHDFDLATAYFKFAVVDLYENLCEVEIYDTEKQELYRRERVSLKK